jgi:hypothetical protein
LSNSINTNTEVLALLLMEHNHGNYPFTTR